jgi:hypothetical protein
MENSRDIWDSEKTRVCWNKQHKKHPYTAEFMYKSLSSLFSSWLVFSRSNKACNNKYKQWSIYILLLKLTRNNISIYKSTYNNLSNWFFKFSWLGTLILADFLPWCEHLHNCRQRRKIKIRYRLLWENVFHFYFYQKI